MRARSFKGARREVSLAEGVDLFNCLEYGLGHGKSMLLSFGRVQGVIYKKSGVGCLLLRDL